MTEAQDSIRSRLEEIQQRWTNNASLLGAVRLRLANVEPAVRPIAVQVTEVLEDVCLFAKNDIDYLLAELATERAAREAAERELNHARTRLDRSRVVVDRATEPGESGDVHANGAAAAAEHVCPWKDAIIDACVVDWVYTAEHDRDPRRAVNDLLCHQARISLDPDWSSEAKALHQRIAELEAELTRERHE